MKSTSTHQANATKPRNQTGSRQISKRRRAQPAQPATLSKAECSNGESRLQIQDLAYFIYVHQGRPHGRHLEHWLEAEARLKQAE